jgi:hypothetical protein
MSCKTLRDVQGAITRTGSMYHGARHGRLLIDNRDFSRPDHLPFHDSLNMEWRA